MKDGYTVRLNNFRMAPRKVRLVADLVRGKKVDRALNILQLSTKKASPVLIKLIKSGVDSAISKNSALDLDVLKIAEIQVNGGTAMKRFLPRAQGRATQIKKRFCHVKLTLQS